VGELSDRPIPAPETRPDFYLTVVSGLEQVAASELTGLGAKALSTRPNKVFLSHPGDPRPLLDLRSAMHLYAFIAEHRGCPANRSAQTWFEQTARGLDLQPALALHAALHGRTDSPSFRVTAARSGQHDYTSPEIAAWVGTGLQAHTSWEVDLEDYDYEIEAELADDRALFGLRVGAKWRDRRGKPVYHPASLNPTVAYAMISLTGHGPADVFLDPACGGGTLLAERAALGPARLILGGDIWPRALDYSRRTLAASGAVVPLLRWDAGRLPLQPSAVDHIASNLPFGHRVGWGPTVHTFYRRLLPEIARVLRPGGRAALLTSRKRWLSRAIADDPQLHWDRRCRIVLGGKEAFIFLISRTH